MPARESALPLVKPAVRALRRLEDGVLALLLASMIAIAAYQVVARNLFDTGLMWGDALGAGAGDLGGADRRHGGLPQ